MYIARDKDERLWLYKEKPYKSEIDNVWTNNGDLQPLELEEDWFPEIEWEDEEPRELVLKPLNGEQGFVNLYKDCGQVKVGWKIFPTKKEAEDNFKDEEKYITTANIQWEKHQ